jgi:hypothetical protein
MPTRKKLQNTQKDKSYEAFLQGLDLVSLGLKSCSSSLDRGAFFEIARKGKKMVKMLKDEYRLSRFEGEWFDAEGCFTLTVSETSIAIPWLKIDFVLDVHIHGKALMEKAYVERFTDSELGIILTPYARHFVTNITGQMAIPPVVLPLATVRR